MRSPAPAWSSSGARCCAMGQPHSKRRSSTLPPTPSIASGRRTLTATDALQHLPCTALRPVPTLEHVTECMVAAASIEFRARLQRSLCSALSEDACTRGWLATHQHLELLRPSPGAVPRPPAATADEHRRHVARLMVGAFAPLRQAWLQVAWLRQWERWSPVHPPAASALPGEYRQSLPQLEGSCYPRLSSAMLLTFPPSSHPSSPSFSYPA